MSHRHPANQARYDHATRAERFAEQAVTAIGSLRFLFWQTVIVGLWIGVNLAGVALRWDPYPFILLNLAFSTQAAYAAPLILLAGNRAAEHDRAVAEETHASVADILAHLDQRSTAA